jgi:hypothetical protein
MRAEVRPATSATASERSGVPDSQLDFELLTQRAQRDPVGDPFDARSWEALAAEDAQRNAPPPPPPPPPQAPPVPFTFMGKLIDADRITVFLTNGNHNWAVRAGDTIDGAYRVEAIGDRTMTLTYLALGKQQELAIGEASAPPVQPIGLGATSEALPAPSRNATPPPGQLPLLLAAPARVTAGNEFVVSVGLPPGGARAARVELAYDASLLAAVGATAAGAGRVTVELGGTTALAQVRFRVITAEPTTTRIGVGSATATDARGAGLAVAPPAAHSVQIVRAGG